LVLASLTVPAPHNTHTDWGNKEQALYHAPKWVFSFTLSILELSNI
jgi:hypothetical protein